MIAFHAMKLMIISSYLRSTLVPGVWCRVHSLMMSELTMIMRLIHINKYVFLFENEIEL